MSDSESGRIADQLRQAFSGDPWFGSPIRELLKGIDVATANARPVASAHSIWEMVLHIDLYVAIVLEAINGVPMPRLFGTERDWPQVADGSEQAWAATLDLLFQHAELLAAAIDQFPDDRLSLPVPGREYNFYDGFHGAVQHSIYHAGQITILKKAASERR